MANDNLFKGLLPYPIDETIGPQTLVFLITIAVMPAQAINCNFLTSYSPILMDNNAYMVLQLTTAPIQIIPIITQCSQLFSILN